MNILKFVENFEVLKFFENFEILNFKFKKKIILEFLNVLKILKIVGSFEICCPMKKRFKGEFNSLSCNSLLKTIEASIDHRGAKNAKMS